MFIFNSPSVQHSKKPLDNYEKVLLFLHTTIIANYRHCTNIQIHRCGRRFEQQTGICYSKGTQRLHVVSYPRRHRPIQRKRIQAVQTDGWRWGSEFHDEPELALCGFQRNHMGNWQERTRVPLWYKTRPFCPGIQATRKRSERTSNPYQLRFCGCQQRNMALQWRCSISVRQQYPEGDILHRDRHRHTLCWAGQQHPHPQSLQPIGHLEDTNQRTILS